MKLPLACPCQHAQAQHLSPLPCQRRSVWCAREQPGQQCSLSRGSLEQREFLPEGIPCQLQPGAIPWGQWPRPVQSPAHKVCSQTETLPSERALAQGDSSLRLSLGRAQAGGRGGECGAAQVGLITAIKAHKHTRGRTFGLVTSESHFAFRALLLPVLLWDQAGDNAIWCVVLLCGRPYINYRICSLLF